MLDRCRVPGSQDNSHPCYVPGWLRKREVGIPTTMDKQASYFLERTQTNVVAVTSPSLSLRLSLSLYLSLP